MHSQGNFVVLKLLEVAEPMDCMPLAGVLLPQAILITSKKQFHGLQIMLKLVFKIVSPAPCWRPVHLCAARGSSATGSLPCVSAAVACMYRLEQVTAARLHAGLRARVAVHSGRPLRGVCSKEGRPWQLSSQISVWHAQGQLASTVSHMRGGAQQVLDSFCGLYTREPRQVTWHAHHHLGGQMLVEAAFVALPHANGVEVGSLLLAWHWR